MKPLLLGECPSASGDRYHGFPLSGRPAEFICRLMGWSYEGPAYWELLEHFDTLNALERYTEPWSIPAARTRWERWMMAEGYTDAPNARATKKPLVVVCLGRRAAGAVGVSPARDWGEWLEQGGMQAVVLPHTSGRNRVLNDPAMRDTMRRVLQEAIERAEAASWEGTVA